MTRKVVNFPPEWVAGFTRNQWQLCSRMGGRFEPESAFSPLVVKFLQKWQKNLVTFKRFRMEIFCDFLIAQNQMFFIAMG
jgi:hypothetical protein